MVLDCIGFLRHFLHLFHRLRTQFLEAYQQRVLEDSAVSQILKEAFLTLRLAAESANSVDENDENDLMPRFGCASSLSDLNGNPLILFNL